MALGSLWSCHQFPRIFTFTFLELEGFIITWKITFWLEFCFMSTVLGRCACHIRMHTLMSCQESLFGWHSFRSDLRQHLLGPQSSFVTSSPLVGFWLKILQLWSHLWMNRFDQNFNKGFDTVKMVVQKAWAFRGECSLKVTYFLICFLFLKMNTYQKATYLSKGTFFGKDREYLLTVTYLKGPPFFRIFLYQHDFHSRGNFYGWEDNNSFISK